MDYEMIKRVSIAILNTPNASDYAILVGINAIKTMREPTEKMKSAGSMNLPDYDPSDDDAGICWKNMINAVLND